MTDQHESLTIFDYSIARSVDQFDRLAVALVGYDVARAELDDEHGIHVPPIVLTGLRVPVHDLPMEHESGSSVGHRGAT